MRPLANQSDTVLSRTPFFTAAAVLLVLHLLLLVSSSWNKSPTYDEPEHLKFGLLYLEEGRLPEADAQRMPVTLFNAAALKMSGGSLEDFTSDRRFLLAARLPTMMASLLLGLGLLGWSTACFGRWGGLFTLALYCFSPTVIAHGRLVTNDLYTALACTAAAYAFRQLCRHPSPHWFLLSATALGLAQACKFSSVVLVPAFGVILLVSSARRPLVQYLREKPARWGLVAAYPLVAFFFLGAVYRFDGLFQPMAGSGFHSYAFAWLEVKLPWLRLPLPRVYLEGLDLSRYISTHPGVIRGHNYLFGRLSDEGWWYYYIVIAALKIPLGALGLVILRTVRAIRAKTDERDWKSAPFLIFPALAVLIFFSFFSSVQIGIRYLLPAMVLVMIWVGGLVRQKAGRPVTLTLAALLLAVAISSLAAFPDYISYTGELAGPRIHAWRLMADSNLEWGQDRWYCRDYLEQHPNAILNPPEPTAGHLVVRINLLTGVFHEERYRWLREKFKPVDRVRGSYLVYRISPEELEGISLGSQ